MSSKVELWHRRHALQIAAQLPENCDDALAVLRCAIELVEEFLAAREPQERRVCRFSVAAERHADRLDVRPGSSPNFSAISTVSPAVLPK